MSAICTHTDSIKLTELPDAIAGCQDCLAIRGTWVHLRMCQCWCYLDNVALAMAGS